MPVASAHLATASVVPEAGSQQYDLSTPVTVCLPKMRVLSGGLVGPAGASLVIVWFEASRRGETPPTSRAHPIKVVSTTTSVKATIPKRVIVRTSYAILRLPRGSPGAPRSTLRRAFTFA